MYATCKFYFWDTFLLNISDIFYPLGTVFTLNVHKTFRRGPGRLLNILCTFNLHPVSKA